MNRTNLALRCLILDLVVPNTEQINNVVDRSAGPSHVMPNCNVSNPIVADVIPHPIVADMSKIHLVVANVAKTYTTLANPGKGSIFEVELPTLDLVVADQTTVEPRCQY